MVVNKNWSRDPLVLVQKSIIPVQYRGFDVLCRLMLGSIEGGHQIKDMLACFPIAEKQLRTFGIQFFGPLNLVLNQNHQDICLQAAEAVLHTYNNLLALRDKAEPTQNDFAQCHAFISTRMRPDVHAAIDAFRASFISYMMAQASISNAQSEAALKQLSEISRKIFFISVNASVEAARAGDAGRGFSYIAGEIRDLSKSAQSSATTLLSIIDRPSTPN